MKAAKARSALAAGRLEVSWAGLARTGPITARVRVSDGTVHRADHWRRAGSTLTARCGPVDVLLTIATRGAGARLMLAARARVAALVTEIGIEARPAVAEGAPEWLVYNGYQSWDAAGVVRADAVSKAGAPVKRESWWTAGLADHSGRGLAVSAQAARRSSTRLDWQEGRLTVVACEFPGLKQNPVLWPAQPGARWESDAVVCTAAEDVNWALRLAARTIRGRPARTPPRGWLSWYRYGPWISAAEVLENSAELSHGHLRSLGYHVILIDDGWQQAYGDWVPNTKFPGGFPAVARELTARGQVLGAWTAPFLVSAGADLAAKAPANWFLLDPTTGERAVDPVHVVFGPMYILDARRAAVREHLATTFARLRAEGVEHFKIDFLYAGAYAGTTALRAGLQAIRRGIGDAYLSASGAPLLPVVGICEACRIGRDTASPIFDFELGSPKPTLIGDEVNEVVRNQAARHFLDRWFQLDADVALVGGNLTPEQGRTLVTVAALSGGPFFASDHLAGLPPERLALLVNAGVLALVGAPAAIPDWLPGEPDRASPVWRRQGVIALFNASSEERQVTAKVSGRRRARDLWQGRDLGAVESEITLPVPAGGSRLVALDPG